MPGAKDVLCGGIVVDTAGANGDGSDADVCCAAV